MLQNSDTAILSVSNPIMPAPMAESSCADWQEVLTISIAYLSLHDLIGISACSKAASKFVCSQLSSGESILARSLLQKALPQAADEQHQLSCVRWLLLAAKLPEDILAVDDYFNIPRVPLEVCKLLIAAGVRVSYSQLVSAARNRVEGVGNWVEACRIQGLPSGLDELVEKVCMCQCEDFNNESQRSNLRDQLETINPGDLEDLLYIALNTLGFKQNCQCQPAAKVFNAILYAAPAVAQLSSRACKQLLQSFVEIAAVRKEALYVHALYHGPFRWDKIPAMQQLSGNDLYPIIRNSMELGAATLSLQYDLPGIYLLDAHQIVELLTVILEHAELAKYGKFVLCHNIQGVCQLPAAHEVSSQMCLQVFNLFIETVGCCAQWDAPTVNSIVMEFMSLAGMQQLDETAVSALIRKVIELACNKQLVEWTACFIRPACSLPAAARISKNVIQELLQLAKGLPDVKVQGLMQLLEGHWEPAPSSDRRFLL